MDQATRHRTRQVPHELGPRKKFSPEEDMKLRALVNGFTRKNWEEIATFMGDRTARQCRDRFQNYLLDSLVSQPWTPQEDAIIVEQFHHIGPRWVEIGKLLNGRSGNNVKNRWHKHLCKLDSSRPAPVPPPAPQTESAGQNELPAVVEKTSPGVARPVGISDCDWQQIFAPLEKDLQFSGLWTGVFSAGEPFF
jgi:hypothetical protein